MINGHKKKFTANDEQSNLLNNCIGATTFIYNGKCQENEYFWKFATKFIPINQWRNKGKKHYWIDQKYSHFKTE
jgi:hypothetical protein